MQRKPVESSTVSTIGYDSRTRVLEVEFSGGRVYRYSGVSPQKNRALMSSDSIGSYINRRIVDEHAVRRIK